MTLKNIFHSSFLFKSLIASADQAALSALNFLISIILIKNVAKIEYGYYSIAFTIGLLLISVQNAVVNTPLAVQLIEKKGEAKQKYPASLCYGQFFFILPAVCLGLIGSGLLSYFGFDKTVASIVATFSFSTIGLLFREFLRAYFFAEESPLKVLKLDIFYVLSMMVFLIVVYIFYRINVYSIFIIIGSCSLLVCLFFVRDKGWLYNIERIKKNYKENWKFGKWALSGVFVTHIQNYSYLYLLSAIIGSYAVADVSAARLLMMPLVLFQAGWVKVVVPHGSKLREEYRIHHFFKEQILVSFVYIIIVAAYVIILLGFSTVIERNLLSEKYSESFDFILLWGILFSIGFAGLNASYGLQVTKRFDIIAKVNFLTMLLTIGCCYIFIKSFEIKGGLIALIIGQTLLAVVLWYYFWKVALFKFKAQKKATTKSNMRIEYLKTKLTF